MGFYPPNSTNLRSVAMSILAVSGREESSNFCEITLKASLESYLLGSTVRLDTILLADNHIGVLAPV